MRRLVTACCFLVLSVTTASAQQLPEVRYTLRVDTAAPAVMHVRMNVRGVAETFVVAAAAHPEYDDKYWRYLESFQSSAGAVTRLDSVRWQVSGSRGSTEISYRIRIPPSEVQRPSWRAYVDKSGGLVGGPHSFLYVLGAESATAQVSLEMPNGWTAATALTRAAGENQFTAQDIAALMESPILIGHLREWNFTAGGVPHRVVYWPQPNATPFDTAAFVQGIRRYTTKAIEMFGGAPYREFTFLFRDDSWTGGLEHPTSVTLGAPSEQLAQNTSSHLYDTAHEFFHTWNLMAIRPAEYRGVDYRVQPPVAGLWFSEGLTMFYADLLLRRAGGAGITDTRAEHVVDRMENYIGNPGNLRFSAEYVSRRAYNAGPAAFGDYDAGTHTQGEIIGTMLDIIVRAATKGERSMDDVMRLMYQRSSQSPGFTGVDVERAVEQVCSCEVTNFFDAHIRGSAPVDYNRYLALIGMRARVEQAVQRGSDGQPQPDIDVGSWDSPDGKSRVRIRDPQSAWGRAGLHTGDVLVSVNGAPVPRWLDFRRMLSAMKVGDNVPVVVSRDGREATTIVTITAYMQPSVALEELSNVTDQQRRLRAEWLSGR